LREVWGWNSHSRNWDLGVLRDSWNFIALLCHDLHSFKVLHTKWCSPHYECVMWKEIIERITAPKNEWSIIFLNVLPMFFFILTNSFVFDHLINFYASHHYYTTHVLWCQPIYTFTNMLMTRVFIFQKKGKRFKHSNLVYLLSYLTKMKQKTKPFANEIIQNKLINPWLKRYICE